MKRKIKIGPISLLATVLQYYCFERRNSNRVISKREFLRKYYKDYVEAQQSELGKNVKFVLLYSFYFR
jgi:hypothetical protein